MTDSEVVDHLREILAQRTKQIDEIKLIVKNLQGEHILSQATADNYQQLLNSAYNALLDIKTILKD